MADQNAPQVIDAHVNLGSDLAIPPRFIEEQAANVYHRLVSMGQNVPRKRIFDRVVSLYQDHDADRLVEEMDTAGVDRAVLIVPDFTHAVECRLSPEELAALHNRICRRHPGRFKVLWGVDPRAGDDGIALFEKCIGEYGFSGLKLYPLTGYSPSDERLYPYYEICADRKLPVLSHTGPGWQPLDFSFGRPLLIDRAARDFPTVNFVLGHGGVTHIEEATYLCGHRPNVHLDISGFHGVLDADGWQVHLNRLFKLGLNHKIIFGTSWPAFRLSTSLGQLLKEFTDGTMVFDGVKKSNRKLIMTENIRRLLGEADAVRSGVQK